MWRSSPASELSSALTASVRTAARASKAQTARAFESQVHQSARCTRPQLCAQPYAWWALRLGLGVHSLQKVPFSKFAS
jgi:hypothetical protein